MSKIKTASHMDEKQVTSQLVHSHEIKPEPRASAFSPTPRESRSHERQSRDRQPREPIPLSVYKPKPVPRSRYSTSSSRAKLHLKTPSPTPPSSVRISRERRSVDSVELYKSAIGVHKGRHESVMCQTPTYGHESYDTLIVSSIYQLSQKLKSQTDRTLEKLRDTEVIENGLESPLDELENLTALSEIPAYKSANQELAGVLRNLRKLEQHIKVINKVLFPDDEGSPDTSKEKHEYMQQIERIKNELAGFQPIETPRTESWKDETASIESDCEELSHAEYY